MIDAEALAAFTAEATRIGRASGSLQFYIFGSSLIMSSASARLWPIAPGVERVWVTKRT